MVVFHTMKTKTTLITSEIHAWNELRGSEGFFH